MFRGYRCESTSLDSRKASRERCQHPVDAPHLKRERIGATIHLETMLLAESYLEQDRVLDAEVEEDCKATLGQGSASRT